MKNLKKSQKKLDKEGRMLYIKDSMNKKRNYPEKKFLLPMLQRSTYKHILTFFFIFLLFSSIIYSKNSCAELFTQTDTNSLCNLFVSEFKKGEDVSSITDKVKNFVFQKIKLGEKRVLQDDNKCYKIEGIQISLFYEDKNGVKVDKLLDYGKTTSSIISVKSCQNNETRNEGKTFSEISIHIFWSTSEADSIILSADKKQLSPEETSKIKIKVKCGDCYLSGKKISLNSSDSGEITPKEIVTGEDGVATALFTLKKPEVTEVTAFCGKLKSSISFNPAQVLWNLLVTVNHKGKTCCKNCMCLRFKQWKPIYYTEFRYQAKFENIPLNRYVAMSSNYPVIFPSSLSSPLGNPINANSSITAKVKRFTCKYCENCHWEEDSFQGSSKSFVIFELPLGVIKKPESLIISFSMGGVVETKNEGTILYAMDPSVPYMKTEIKSLTNFIISRFLMPVYIPFSRINTIQPFSLDYTFSNGNCTKGDPDTARNFVGSWKFTFNFYPIKNKKIRKAQREGKKGI